MAGHSREAFEGLLAFLTDSSGQENPRGAFKGAGAIEASQILRRCQSVEILDVQESEKTSKIKVKLIYNDPYRKKIQNSTGLIELSRTDGFWRVESSSPVFGQAVRLLGDPKYVVRERWIDGYFPDSLLLSDFSSTAGFQVIDRDSVGPTIATKEGAIIHFLDESFFKVTVTSTTLRTKEGLGVGNTVGEFRDAFWVPSAEELRELAAKGEFSPISMVYSSSKTSQKLSNIQLVLPAIRKGSYQEGDFKYRSLGLVIDIDPEHVKEVSDSWRVWGLYIGIPRQE